MQLPLSDARAVRMLQALFAAADPLGRLDRGASERAYDTLAVATLAKLRDGARVSDLILLLNEHALVDAAGDSVALRPVVAFAQAAADWWVNAEGRWAPDSDLAADGQYSKVVTRAHAGH